jgi:hypothetical protein
VYTGRTDVEKAETFDEADGGYCNRKSHFLNLIYSCDVKSF